MEKNTNYKRRTESSLNRIFNHTKIENGFFMVSAFHQGESYKENYRRHKDLQRILKKNKLGYVVLTGFYTYDDGTTEKELSVFVPYRDIFSPYEFKRAAIGLGRKYEQESIIVKLPDDKDFSLISISGKYDVEKLMRFHPNKISKSYTALRNQPNATFTLESFLRPKNTISARQYFTEGLIWIPENMYKDANSNDEPYFTLKGKRIPNFP